VRSYGRAAASLQACVGKPASRSNSERFHGSLPLLVLTFVLGIPTTDRCRPAPVSSSRIAKGQTETDALPVSVSVSDPPISKSMSDRQAQKEELISTARVCLDYSTPVSALRQMHSMSASSQRL
jgi:hypothetical protein